MSTALKVRFIIAATGAVLTTGALPASASADYVVANSAGNSVTFYTGLPGSPTGPPTRTISGPATGLAGPFGIAMSPSGILYVANQGNNSVTVYAAGATGNAAPTRTIAGSATRLSSPEGIAVGTGTIAGRIVVANANSNSISEYGATASGDAKPVARIAGLATGLARPRGVALDGANRLFVTNTQGDSVTEYGAGRTGDAVPLHTLQGDATGLSEPGPIALSSFDDFVVGDGGQSDLTVYQAGAWGNARPSNTIFPIDGLITPGGLAITDNDHLAVTGIDSDNVDLIQTDGTVVGSDSGAASGISSPSGLVVRVPLTLNAAPALLPSLTVGSGYSEHSLAFGGVWPYAWSIASGTLPAGLKLDPVTGGISGTPTKPGTSRVVVKVSDSAVAPASATNVRIYTVNPAIQPAVYVSNGVNTLVNAFALSSSGNVTPWTTFGSTNGINAASGLAFDTMGHLFVANYDGGNITEYPPGPAKTPIASQGGLTTPAGITVGPQVVVTQQAANTVTGFSYDPTTGLLGGHAFDINGPHTGLSAPAGVVVAGGRLWVADYGNDSLTAYQQGASGDAAPVATISGPLTGLSHPDGLGVDANGNLLVANQFGNSITSYRPSDNGNVSPVRSIIGPDTQLSQPLGVDVDSTGRVYVSSSNNDAIEIFAATASGDAIPTTSYGGPLTGIAAPQAVAVAPPMSILTVRLPRGRAGRRYRTTLRAAEGTTPYRWSLRRGRLPRGLHLSRAGVITGVPKHRSRRRFTVALRDSSRPRITLTKRLVLDIRHRRRLNERPHQEPLPRPGRPDAPRRTRLRSGGASSDPARGTAHPQ